MGSLPRMASASSAVAAVRQEMPPCASITANTFRKESSSSTISARVMRGPVKAPAPSPLMRVSGVRASFLAVTICVFSVDGASPARLEWPESRWAPATFEGAEGLRARREPSCWILEDLKAKQNQSLSSGFRKRGGRSEAKRFQEGIVAHFGTPAQRVIPALHLAASANRGRYTG